MNVQKQIFETLDETFGVFPHPDGELEYEGQPVAVYSFYHQEFVPFDVLYGPISEMLNAGLEQEDI